MKTRLTMAAAAFALAVGTAQACDDHDGTCEIEDWRWQSIAVMDAVMLDGVATCNEGRIALRLYEGEGGKFLGADTAYIDQHIFQAAIQGIKSPSDIAIKYSISPE